MNVFVAGGSGAIGVPLIRVLIANGHQVTASTRTPANAPRLQTLGATPVIADALDADALRRVVIAAHPTHVIHQLTALPKGGPRSARDLVATNRLRIDGTRNLLAAAIAAGARRIVGGSFALIGASTAGVPEEVRPAAEAIASMETQILEANQSGAIEGVVLRYGLFYGPEVASTVEMVAMAKRRLLPAVRGDRSLLPCIHVDDGERDAGGAGSSAGRRPLRHRGRRANQFQRDRASAGRRGGSAAAVRHPGLAAAARCAVHGADDRAAAAVVQCDGTRGCIHGGLRKKTFNFCQ